MPRERRRPTIDRGFVAGLAVLLVVGWWLQDTPRLGADGSDYGGAATLVRFDAQGQRVRFADARGRPLLVVYTAEWSRDAVAQQAAVRTAAPSGWRVVYVLTSAVEGYGHPATPATAAAWAARHGLPPADVWAADLTAKPLPALALFDAEGRLVAEHEGLLRGEALRHWLASRAPMRGDDDPP